MLYGQVKLVGLVSRETPGIEATLVLNGKGRNGL